LPSTHHKNPSIVIAFGEDGSGKLIGSSQALAAGRDVWSCTVEDIKGEFAQGGKVFRAVVLAIAGSVLVEDNVAYSVKAVLHRAVGAGDLQAHEDRSKCQVTAVSPLRSPMATAEDDA
jgi:hypothetical protein